MLHAFLSQSGHEVTVDRCRDIIKCITAIGNTFLPVFGKVYPVWCGNYWFIIIILMIIIPDIIRIIISVFFFFFILVIKSEGKIFIFNFKRFLEIKRNINVDESCNWISLSYCILQIWICINQLEQKSKLFLYSYWLML